MKEERKLFFVCYILDLYYSLNRPKFRLLFMKYCRLIQKQQAVDARLEISL